MQRRLLDPAGVMFREGVLPPPGEHTAAADPSSCASVLGAISAGVARPPEISAALGRPEGTLADVLAALFSRSGFAAGLTDEAAARPDVELVDLERIYQGT